MIARDSRIKFRKSIIPKGFKSGIYLCLSLIALFLSSCFKKTEIQLIAFSVITGAKWIVSGRNSKINIFIGKEG